MRKMGCFSLLLASLMMVGCGDDATTPTTDAGTVTDTGSGHRRGQYADRHGHPA
jgi:uncharacterized protein YcfL